MVGQLLCKYFKHRCIIVRQQTKFKHIIRCFRTLQRKINQMWNSAWLLRLLTSLCKYSFSKSGICITYFIEILRFLFIYVAYCQPRRYLVAKKVIGNLPPFYSAGLNTENRLQMHTLLSIKTNSANTYTVLLLLICLEAFQKQLSSNEIDFTFIHYLEKCYVSHELSDEIKFIFNC